MQQAHSAGQSTNRERNIENDVISGANLKTGYVGERSHSRCVLFELFSNATVVWRHTNVVIGSQHPESNEEPTRNPTHIIQ